MTTVHNVSLAAPHGKSISLCPQLQRPVLFKCKIKRSSHLATKRTIDVEFFIVAVKLGAVIMYSIVLSTHRLTTTHYTVLIYSRTVPERLQYDHASN